MFPKKLVFAGEAESWLTEGMGGGVPGLLIVAPSVARGESLANGSKDAAGGGIF